jgi:hypothetical protein
MNDSTYGMGIVQQTLLYDSDMGDAPSPTGKHTNHLSEAVSKLTDSGKYRLNLAAPL